MEDETKQNARERLEAEKARLDKLPLSSAYAAHRRRCVSRALELLNVTRLSSEAEDELAQLLGTLSM